MDDTVSDDHGVLTDVTPSLAFAARVAQVEGDLQPAHRIRGADAHQHVVPFIPLQIWQVDIENAVGGTLAVAVIAAEMETQRVVDSLEAWRVARAAHGDWPRAAAAGRFPGGLFFGKVPAKRVRRVARDVGTIHPGLLEMVLQVQNRFGAQPPRARSLPPAPGHGRAEQHGSQ